MENRLPGGDTNPYLTCAATFAAGVAGNIEKIEPLPDVIGNTGPDYARGDSAPAGIGICTGLAGRAVCGNLHRNA